MNKTFLALFPLFLIGCHKKEVPERQITVLSAINNIPISYLPPDPALETDETFVSYSGNLNWHKRVSNINGDNSKIVIYIKTSKTKEWQQLPADGMSATYDPNVHEVRFHYCFEGYAYTIFVITTNTTLL